MEYEHAGVTISFDAGTAKFLAVIDGKRVQSASLASIKKSIDKAAEFTPFDAIENNYSGEFITLRVTGIKKDRATRYGSNGYMWLTSRGEKRDVIADTPENREKLNALANLRAAHKKDREKAQQAEADLSATIERKKAAP
jgi:hypothetical protein